MINRNELDQLLLKRMHVDYAQQSKYRMTVMPRRNPDFDQT